MAGLRCDSCGDMIEGWAGKVVADRAQYEGAEPRVDRLQVVCDRCFGRLGGQLLRLWELRWLKEHSIWVHRDLLQRVAADRPSRAWSPGAIQTFLALGASVHPDDAEEPRDA